MKRGRPPQPVDPEARSRWLPELNGGRECPINGWTCQGESSKGHFLLRCNKHVGLLQLDSVRRRQAGVFSCRFCHGKGSQPWRSAVGAIEGIEGVGRLAFESHLLHNPPGEGGKPFDIYLVQHQLAVEVDGSYHFHGSMHGVPAWKQYAWDRQVDAACRREGQRLVRLHYLDKAQWASKVQEAMSSQQPVTYTKSYRL